MPACLPRDASSASRAAGHPWGVLAIEAVVAAVLAFVPPLQWVIWFGINGWLKAMVGGFVQPLAVAWLGVVILRGFHQLRDGAVTDRRRTDGSHAETADGPTRVIASSQADAES